MFNVVFVKNHRPDHVETFDAHGPALARAREWIAEQSEAYVAINEWNGDLLTCRESYSMSAGALHEWPHEQEHAD